MFEFKVKQLLKSFLKNITRAPNDNLRSNMYSGESNCSKNFGSTLPDFISLLKHHLKDSQPGKSTGIYAIFGT